MLGQHTKQSWTQRVASSAALAPAVVGVAMTLALAVYAVSPALTWIVVPLGVCLLVLVGVNQSALRALQSALRALRSQAQQEDQSRAEERRRQDALLHTQRTVLAAFAGEEQDTTGLARMLKILVTQSGWQTACVFGLQTKRKKWTPVAAHNPPTAWLAEMSTIHSPVAKAAQSSEPLSWPSHHPLLRAIREEASAPHFVTGFPMGKGPDVTHVMLVASPRPLDSTERHMLTQIVEMVGLQMHDRTQMARVEDLLKEAKRLKKDIAETTEALKRANRLKSEFLANMSHELRTPLNAVIGFSDLMADGLAGPMTAQQQGYVKDIWDSGQHLLALINDILDLSKIEAGKMTLTTQPIDPEAFFKSSLTIVRERASKGGIRLFCELDPALPTFCADERKLRQILYNLLSNAVKFTDKGGLVGIVARFNAHDNAVNITVSDSGIGISEHNKNRIFQPFEQLDGSITRRHDGTGLGLALVRKLAALHGGDVTLESSPSKGSKFTVHLPFVDETSSQAAPHQSANLLPVRPRTPSQVAS